MSTSLLDIAPYPLDAPDTSPCTVPPLSLIVVFPPDISAVCCPPAYISPRISPPWISIVTFPFTPLPYWNPPPYIAWYNPLLTTISDLLIFLPFSPPISIGAPVLFIVTFLPISNL